MKLTIVLVTTLLLSGCMGMKPYWEKDNLDAYEKQRCAEMYYKGELFNPFMALLSECV